MKAAVFLGPGRPLAIQEMPEPEISPEEMLLKVRFCGICGTDIHASREGPFAAPPNTVFGHEFVGEIVRLGDRLKGGAFAVGDRVTSLPFIGGQTIGLGAIPGAYGEYVKVGHELVVGLPAELDDRRAALIEPLAVGLHAVRMAGSVAGRKVLVIGAGPIGLTTALWCRFFGAGRLVISEMSEARIRKARELGFADLIDPAEDVGARFRQLTGSDPEIQFECVGAPGLLQACIDRAPKLGLIMGIGLCDEPDTIQPLPAFTRELRIQWAVGYEKADFEFAIDMCVAGRMDASAMITDEVSLDEVPEAFERLRTPTDQCKVLIDLTRG